MRDVTPKPNTQPGTTTGAVDAAARQVIEAAGMGDRFFDLANLSVNQEFGAAEDEILLASYFGEATAADLASLGMMKFMSDFREAMWGVLQSGISELDFDFTGYAAKHFDRLAAHSRALRVE